MVRCQPDMLVYIRGKCRAVIDPSRFVDIWIQSDRNPCSVCDTYKSKCRSYKELVAKGMVGGEEDSLWPHHK